MIPIAKAKEIREELNLTHLVIFGVDADDVQYVATHGETEQHAKEAAKAGNKLKKALGWPEDLCKEKPLQRICENCTFYKPDFGIYCFNGWSKDGSGGYCHFEPKRIWVDGEQKCSHFEPNR